MTPRQLVLILQARYKLALLILVLTVSITVGASLAMTKQYTASAALVVDVKSPDPISGALPQGMMTSAYMSTQIDIINSDRVAKAVIKLLHLGETPAIRQQWQEATKGKGRLDDWLAKRLMQKLDVKPAKDSNVITINYTGTTPDFAAAVANAFSQAYQDVNLDLRLAPARQYAAFFEEQTKAARDKLEAAQAVMSTYQQVHGITTTDERMDYELARLNEASSQLTAVQGQTTDSLSKRMNARPDTLAEVMQSTLTNGLKADIARMESKLAENSGNLGKNHPSTLQSEQELAAMKAQLAAETQKITTSVETTYQVNKQRERQLQETLASQKSRVLELNKQRDELNVMRRDIESAQRTFELLSQRASQATTESRTNQTNIALLNAAVPPQDPSKPRLLLNTLISVILGGLLGLTAALVMELTHRRVRSADDMMDALNIPSLGSVVLAGGFFGRTSFKALK